MSLDANIDQHPISKRAVVMILFPLASGLFKSICGWSWPVMATAPKSSRCASDLAVMKTAPARNCAIPSEAALSPLAANSPLEEQYHAHLPR